MLPCILGPIQLLLAECAPQHSAFMRAAQVSARLKRHRQKTVHNIGRRGGGGGRGGVARKFLELVPGKAVNKVRFQTPCDCEATRARGNDICRWIRQGGTWGEGASCMRLVAGAHCTRAHHAWWSAFGDVITGVSNSGSTVYSPIFPPAARMEGMLKSTRVKRE